MRQITEAEAWELAGDFECPVLAKEESDAMEAAVCLKQFPGGYLLGVSDKLQDLHLWFTPDRAAAEQRYAEHVRTMRLTGSPFGSAV